MNLTETSIFVKRAAVICVVFFFGFFIVKFSFLLLGAAWLKINPPPPPAVTTIFGQLPPIIIPKLPLESADNITYTVDTPTGKFPALPTQLTVFKIPHPPATLLSDSRARALARSMGFVSEPIRVSSSDLHWDDVPNSRSLDVNIVTNVFKMKTSPQKLALDLSPGTAPTQAQAINVTLAFFTNRQLLAPDYLQGNQTTSLIKLTAGNYSEAQSLSDAQITRVNLFRQAEKLNVYGPSPKEGMIQAEATALPNNASFAAINFYGWTLDTAKTGSYPLKSADKALLELKSGQGSFTYLQLRGQDKFTTYVPLNLAQVSIRTVELAYYDSQLVQDFLQPMYVFSGIFKTTGGSEGDFVAYVPAVDASWITTK